MVQKLKLLHKKRKRLRRKRGKRNKLKSRKKSSTISQLRRKRS
jgi:hypothetical protein